LEEGLIAVLAAVAGILLFLGLAQALDARPPRLRRRESRPLDSLEEHGAAPSGTPAATPSGPSTVLAPPSARPEPPLVELQTRGAAALTAEPSSLQITIEPEVATAESCAALLLDGQHEAALAAAEASLAQIREGGLGASSRGVPWLGSVAALSRLASGDDAGARAAFAAAAHAIHDCSADRPARLQPFCLTVASRCLEAAAAFPKDVPERIDALRLAGFWARVKQTELPGEGDAHAIIEATREALSQAYRDIMTGAIQHREWAAAHRLIEAGHARGELDAAQAEILADALGDSLGREAGRLVAPVVRGARDESRALGGLERAEALMTSMSEGGLPARHLAPMARRVWRAHAAVGMRKLEEGNLDESESALVRALAMKQIGRRQQDRVREALVRTIETAADRTRDVVTAALTAGDRSSAEEQVRRLLYRIDAAKVAGLAESDLEGASSKAASIAERVDAQHPS
jgi:hypothetical protein